MKNAPQIFSIIAGLTFTASIVQAEVNVLANPQWDPTIVTNTTTHVQTTNSDGGRFWTYSNQNTTNRAYQLNDFWSVGHPGAGDGSKGVLKCENDGQTTNSFQSATSPWYIANPGNQWTASAWFNTFGNLKGTETGMLKVEIANRSFTVITNYALMVVTNGSSGYTLGNLKITVPTNGAYIRMQAGLFNPNSGNPTGGSLIVDDACLSSPNQFLSNPGWDQSLTVPLPSNNGGRHWTYTAGAAQNNDAFNVGRNGSGTGSLGFSKTQITGPGADGSFVYAASQWHIAAPGNSWVASVFGRSEGGTSLKGTQAGIVVLQYADVTSNILTSITNTVVTTNSGSAYQIGAASSIAPSNTVMVRMLVGVYQPTTNASGYALFDDASLTTTNQTLANPGFDPTRAGNADVNRNWTPTDLAEGQIVKDAFNLARSGSGSSYQDRGFQKSVVDGSIAPDFQGVASDWYPAVAGQVYQAGAYAKNENLDLHGNQQGVLVLDFADASSNVLASVTNVIVSAIVNTNAAYFLGVTNSVAPANTALVRVQVGLFAPNYDGPGHVLFDDASLMPVVYSAPAFPAFFNSVSALPANAGFQLVFSGTNGNNYSLLGSTNVAQPVSGWDVLVTGTFGSLPVTNIDPTSMNHPQRFYQIKTQ